MAMRETRGPQDSALPSPRGRKRRPSEPLLHPQPKRQVLVSNPVPFINWDRLPKILLTKSALRELDRRNSLLQTGLSSAEQRPQPEQDQRTTLKRFARGGGPDLTGLRGVSHTLANDPIRAHKSASTHGECRLARALVVRAKSPPGVLPTDENQPMLLATDKNQPTLLPPLAGKVARTMGTLERS